MSWHPTADCAAENAMLRAILAHLYARTDAFMRETVGAGVHPDQVDPTLQAVHITLDYAHWCLRNGPLEVAKCLESLSTPSDDYLPSGIARARTGEQG